MGPGGAGVVPPRVDILTQDPFNDLPFQMEALLPQPLRKRKQSVPLLAGPVFGALIQAVSTKGRVGLALDFDLTKTPALGPQKDRGRERGGTGAGVQAKTSFV